MRAFAIGLISLWATSHAFAPPLHVRHTSLLEATKTEREEQKTCLGQKIKRAGKGLKRSVAAVAFASLAFRQPREVDAAVSLGPLAFASTTERHTASKVLPVVTVVVAAAGVGTAAAKYILKRADDSEDLEETVSSVFTKTKKSPSAGTKKSPSAGTKKSPSTGTKKSPSTGTKKSPSAGTKKRSAETKTSSPTETEESSQVESAEAKAKRREQEIIAEVLKKVKYAEKKALEATVIAAVKEEVEPEAEKMPILEVEVETKPVEVATLEPEVEQEPEAEIEPVVEAKVEREAVTVTTLEPEVEQEPEAETEMEPVPEVEVETKPVAVSNLEPKVEEELEVETEPVTVSKQEPEAGEEEPVAVATLEPEPVFADDPAAFSSAEKLKIANTVFECHGFFPDLRNDEQLSPKVRKMRQQPKSRLEKSSLKKKYDAIPDESERVYTMLVDLGMMESYDHLEDYNDNFDDDEL